MTPDERAALQIHWEKAEADAQAEIASLRAALETAQTELARWKICENCGEPLAGPGICDRAISESEKGLELMLEETLQRAEQAEAALTRAQAAQREQLQEYGRHNDDCDVWMWELGFTGVTFSQPQINLKQSCSCGFLAALRHAGDAPPETT